MAKALLRLEDVEVRRGMGVVLSGRSLTVLGGQTVVLSGANGSGKTTLLEAAMGLLPLEKGCIHHGDVVVADHEGRRRPSPFVVGVVLQKNGMLGSETVSQHLQCSMAMAGFSTDIAPFLKAFNLTHRANDLVAHLSQGQARKIAVLAGLLPAFASPSPSLVLLDEPDAGLDDASVKTLGDWLEELRSSGHGLVIATHDDRIKQQATHLVDIEHDTVTPLENRENRAPQQHPSKAVPTQSAGSFGVKMHLRTMMWLNTNAMAGLLTLGILLSLGSFMNGLDRTQQLSFVLAPALAAGLCGEPLVAALREERAGEWWRAVSRKEPHGAWIPAVLGFVFTLMASVSLQNQLEPVVLLVGGLLCFVVWHGVGWVQRSTQRLARPQAVFVGLLTPVLILPYALIAGTLA